MSEALMLNVVETGLTSDADALLSLGAGMLAIVMPGIISWQFRQELSLSWTTLWCQMQHTCG